MDKDKLSEIKDRFSLAYDSEAEDRAIAAEDLRFSWLGEQWPISVQRAREIEGRPCLVINKMPAFMRQVINDARQNRPQIKVLPRDDQADIQTADILNGIIRNIESTSNADVAYDTAIEYAISSGRGYFRVDIDYTTDDSFDLDILIKRIANPFTVYGDPNGSEADASDWSFGFVTDMIPKDEFKTRYKDAEASSWDGGTGDERDHLWFDEDTVRTAEYWERTEIKKPIVKLSSGMIVDAETYKANKDMFDAAQIQVVGERDMRSYRVKQYICTGADILEENDWVGKYIPIIPVYGSEFNIEGKRHFISLIRDAKDAQRMFNYWRTSATESVALAPKIPFIGPVGAFDSDAYKWESANIKSHAYIEYDGTIPPQRQPYAGIPAGAIQEAMNASDDMKAIIGLYDASLGARSNETSGRAILARAHEGDVSTFHFIDNQHRAIRYAGNVLLDIIPKVYDKARIVRILGEDGEPSSVQINKSFVDEKGLEQIYDLSVGKYDVVVKAGPSYTTRREESATQMMEIVKAFPQAAGAIGDLIAKNLDWPGADEISKRLKLLNPALQQGGDNPAAANMIQQGKQLIAQVQQQAQQQMQLMSAEIKKRDDEIINLEREIYKKETDNSTKLYEIDKRSATELEKVKMQNDSKAELATFQSIADSLVISQSQMELKLSELDNKEPDLQPIMDGISGLQQQLANMQPVGIKQIRDASGKLVGGVRILADGTEQKIEIQ